MLFITVKVRRDLSPIIICLGSFYCCMRWWSWGSNLSFYLRQNEYEFGY
jgi:hypothetical protein